MRSEPPRSPRGVALGAGVFVVDGVTVSALEGAEYMPPPPDQRTVDDGVTVTALESANYVPDEP